MSVRIGYQGMEGSNSQEAAIKLAANLGIDEPEFLPLVSSRSVANYLELQKIDYGVLAFKNNIGGTVNETSEALTNLNFETVLTCDMRIHHSLFFKNQSVKADDIKDIVSHEQALFQCEHYISTFFPNANRSKYSDTAAAAEQLKENTFGDGVAVICKKDAGVSRGLYLYEENIEDSESITEFKIIKLSKFTTNNSTDINKGFLRRNNSLRFIFGKPMIFILLMLSLFSSSLAYLLKSYYPLIATALFCILAIVLISVSKKILATIPISNILGYWKYYSTAVSGLDINQMHEYARIVHIVQDGKELKLEGWLPNSTKPFFVSSKILCTEKTQLQGKLVYWYNGTVDIQSSASINGVAVLEWNIENKNKQINKMVGWYLGAASKEIGTLSYTRVSREEFDKFKNERRILI